MSATWPNDSLNLSECELVERIEPDEHPYFEKTRRHAERELRITWGACLASAISLIPCLVFQHSLLPYLLILGQAIYGLVMFRGWAGIQLPDCRDKWLARFPCMIGMVAIVIVLQAGRLFGTW